MAKREAPKQHPVGASAIPYQVLSEGIGFAQVYWTVGPAPRGMMRNDVTRPPNAGWSHVFVIDRGGRHLTLFCPHSFEAHDITRDGYEFFSMRPPRVTFDPAWYEFFLPEQWERTCRFGFVKSFDTAALVMTKLRIPVPTTSTSARADEDKPRGGKDVGVALKKPVKRESKRGAVLAFFLEGRGTSVREGVNEFGITRSNLLSHLFVLQRDHGIGYKLVGDAVKITLPDGCTEPWA